MVNTTPLRTFSFYRIIILFLSFLIIFLVLNIYISQAVTACGILVPCPAIKPEPPHLKCSISTTRPPGKSQFHAILYKGLEHS